MQELEISLGGEKKLTMQTHQPQKCQMTNGSLIEEIFKET